MTEIRYVRKDFKSILRKYRYVDGWFWCRYGVNPYQGCQHACTYCDSRSHKYHLQPDFDRTIVIKNEPDRMLDRRLSRARTLLPDVVAMSGASDPYHPAELEYRNTRGCLSVLLKHGYPVHVLTKSDNVLDDADLLSRIGEKTWCTVSLTVTTTDDEMAAFLEPGAPSPARRLDTIRRLKETGNIQAGVNLIPVVPFLADSREMLEGVVRGASEAGADYILFGGGMTMRDQQANWFLTQLEKEYPEMVERYLQLYGASWGEEGYQGRYAPPSSYTRRINETLFELCGKYGIVWRIKRYIPGDFRRENYIIAEELLNEAYEAQYTGKNWKTIFWAGQNINELKEPIRAVARKGELGKIRNVDWQLEERINRKLEEMKGDDLFSFG